MVTKWLENSKYWFEIYLLVLSVLTDWNQCFLIILVLLKQHQHFFNTIIQHLVYILLFTSYHLNIRKSINFFFSFIESLNFVPPGWSNSINSSLKGLSTDWKYFNLQERRSWGALRVIDAQSFSYYCLLFYIWLFEPFISLLNWKWLGSANAYGQFCSEA